MKQTILLSLLLAVTLTACVTKSQQVIPPVVAGQPPITNEVFLPSPNLAAYQQQTHDTINAVAPLAATVYPPSTVFVPVANTLVDSIFGGIAAISAALAAYKNNQASKQRSAAAALASAIVTTPALVPLAVQNAASNKSTVLVQEHLASANSPT